MDERMIYQNMSQLVFNAMMRGESKEKAMEDAELTVKELVKRAKNIAKLAVEEDAATGQAK